MLDILIKINPVVLALFGGLFTFFITCLGSSIVFFFKKVKKNFFDGLLALSAGIMLASSFFSLINPSLTMAKKLNMIPWLVVFLGILCGTIFLFISDGIFLKKKVNNKNRILLLAITLHNIPEGFAIGIAFGMLFYGASLETLISALVLTFGIGLQNFPEGAAVSLPLRKNKMSRKKSFIIGSLTAVVEPISAFLGAILVVKTNDILPFSLAFAGGSMLYVVIKELIPESQDNKNSSLMTFLTIIGFLIMMVLDVIFSI